MLMLIYHIILCARLLIFQFCMLQLLQIHLSILKSWFLEALIFNVFIQRKTQIFKRSWRSRALLNIGKNRDFICSYLLFTSSICLRCLRESQRVSASLSESQRVSASLSESQRVSIVYSPMNSIESNL